uniref:Uncharacterized protein n=1 Tax=Candidatus Kentrum sp. SD TaxID=2126332 RepID=A0A450YXG6_9GAMM|nr:MAG: hypothetical protein BECKSD772F_GA0070984_10689 [Candidatus Kentron sp. SD]VFK46228.1 MAG: hypothetical protein BECKSD772E_GA0070983_10698 [Candidatus Kentron sp. SD]
MSVVSKWISGKARQNCIQFTTYRLAGYTTRNTLEAGAWVLSSGRQGYFRIHGHQDARIGLARIFSIARDFPMQFTRGAIVFNGMAVSVVVFLMWC